MSTTYFILSMLVGWCGTRWPGWWPRPRPPIPDPEPWWQGVGIRVSIGILGGLAGGWLVTQVFPNEVSLVTVSIGAFVGGRLLSDSYGIALPQAPIQAQNRE